MNKYQKIILLLGLIVFIVLFGKTITRVSFGVLGLLGKGIIIILATLFLIFSLKRSKKNK